MNEIHIQPYFEYKGGSVMGRLSILPKQPKLRDLHASEQRSVSKFGYGLSYKALHPSKIERQNVKLVLKVFSSFVVEALKMRGNELNLNYTAGPAQFIDLILKW